jgi:hypothetical protein
MSDTVTTFGVEEFQEFVFRCSSVHRPPQPLLKQLFHLHVGSCSQATILIKNKTENDYGDSVYSELRKWSIQLKNEWQMMVGMNLRDS